MKKTVIVIIVVALLGGGLIAGAILLTGKSREPVSTTISAEEAMRMSEEAAAESSRQAEVESRRQAEEEFRRQEEQRKLDAVKPKYTQSDTGKDLYGYSATGTLKIGDWIKASDAEALNLGWRAVGGSGDFPNLSDLRQRLGAVPGILSGFSNRSSAVVFGTVKIQNNTPDYQTMTLYTYRKKLLSNLGGICMVIQDSNGIRHVPIDSSRMLADDGYMNAFLIDSNTARNEVPFAIILPAVFTPNHPDGDPGIDGFGFHFGPLFYGGEDNIYIEKTW
jgi:hypothetical protein